MKYLVRSDFRILKDNYLTVDDYLFIYLAKPSLIITGQRYRLNYCDVDCRITKLFPGDIIEIGGISITYISPSVLGISEIIDSDLLIELDDWNNCSNNDFKSGPRRRHNLPDKKVEIKRIPDKQYDTSRISLVLKLVPLFLGVTMSIVFVVYRPSGMVRQVVITIAVLTLLVGLVNLYRERRGRIIHNRKRDNLYEQYLSSLNLQLAHLKLLTNTYYHTQHPPFELLVSHLSTDFESLYSRSIDDHEFLQVAIGFKQQVKWEIVTNPFSSLELNIESADIQLQQMIDNYQTLDDIPLIIDFRTNIGLVGNSAVIEKQLIKLIIQLVYYHSYHHLQLVVIGSEWLIEICSVTEFLPHFVVGEANWSNIHRELRIAEECHLIIITDLLALDIVNLNSSKVVIADQISNLDPVIDTAIEFLTDQQATLVYQNHINLDLNFELEQLTSKPIVIKELISKIAPVNHQVPSNSNLRLKVSWLELQKVKDIKQLNITKRWEYNADSDRLLALIGLAANDSVMEMDFSELGDGPHGLIAGMTGSGKSELIQTIILSLVINYSPSQLNLLLIDFKGGGMAEQFAGLPHISGIMTNLDEDNGKRAIISIQAELKRRQQLFASAGVNNISDYRKLTTGSQIGHLLVICDEFAEMKIEQPDLLKQLVATARIGRSLGIHLILATQKPAGIVDDQIWSNSNFKICLKVAEVQDSKAVIKTAYAANIKNVGEGYLKVGNELKYLRFQTAYCSGNYNPDKQTKVEFINNQRKVTKVLPLEDSQGRYKLLPTVLFEIDKAQVIANSEGARRVWLPPLASSYRLEQTAEKLDDDFIVKLGVVDYVSEQKQLDLTIDLQVDNSILLIGEGQSGKTASLLAICWQLFQRIDSKQCTCYWLNCDLSCNLRLTDVPHISEMLGPNDDERQLRLAYHLQTEVEVRRSKIGNSQQIIIVIDGYRQFTSWNQQLIDIVVECITNGSQLGITVLVSGLRIADIKQQLVSRFKRVIIFTKCEQSDLFNTVGRPQITSKKMSGRAYIKLEQPQLIQLYYLPINQFNNYLKLLNETSTTNNPQLRMMPKQISYPQQLIKSDQLLLGFRYIDIRACYIELGNLVISGPSKSGKTNMLRVLIKQLITNYKLLIIDNQAGELSDFSPASNVDYQAGISNYDFIIINDYNSLSEQSIEQLTAMISSGVKLIVETDERMINPIRNRLSSYIANSSKYICFGSIPNGLSHHLNRQQLTDINLKVGDCYLITSDQTLHLKSISNTHY